MLMGDAYKSNTPLRHTVLQADFIIRANTKSRCNNGVASCPIRCNLLFHIHRKIANRKICSVRLVRSRSSVRIGLIRLLLVFIPFEFWAHG